MHVPFYVIVRVRSVPLSYSHHVPCWCSVRLFIPCPPPISLSHSPVRAHAHTKPLIQRKSQDFFTKEANWCCQLTFDVTVVRAVTWFLCFHGDCPVEHTHISSEKTAEGSKKSDKECPQQDEHLVKELPHAHPCYLSHQTTACHTPPDATRPLTDSQILASAWSHGYITVSFHFLTQHSILLCDCEHRTWTGRSGIRCTRLGEQGVCVD